MSEIQEERETKLKVARLEAGFYNIIGGQKAVSASQLSVINPATREELATVPNISAISLDHAVAAARKAFPSWCALSIERRKEGVTRVLTEIERHADELSTLVTAEQGRPLSQAHWEIELLTKHYGPALIQMDVREFKEEVKNIGQILKRYTPIGVVGAISPWNLPALLSFAKALAALVAGNTVVLKPSPFTPLTVLRISDYIRELLPAGVLNTVTGGDELGPRITAHPGIDYISFTGSVDTGKRVLASASATLKRVSLELGGNDPAIILADADPTAIAQDLFNSMFLLSGQGCICIKRLYIHESIYRAMIDALVTVARSAKVGNGLDPGTVLGPVQNHLQYERLKSVWEEIVKSKATVLFRGEVPQEGKGFFFPITILDNPPEDASFVTQEVFGPIRSTFKYKTVAEAIHRANETSYGLGASVWGKNKTQLEQIARQIEAGTVWINQHAVRNAFVPATAFKNSGIGVEFGQEGLLEYCYLQVIAAKQ